MATIVPLVFAQLSAARAVLAAACAHDRAAEVAAEKLFGDAPAGPTVALGALADDGALVGVAAASGRWVRVLAVHPRGRGRGAGRALLAACEQVCRGHAGAVRIMDQPGNYLAPGVDARNVDTIAWLERRGYRRTGANTSLVLDVSTNPRVTPDVEADARDRAAAAGYTIRRAGSADGPALEQLARAHFSAGWAHEIAAAMPPGDDGSAGVFVAATGERAGGELVGFAVHDGNNRGLGWFGPAGTLETHRGRGIGEALLLACLVDVGRAHDECIVSWIGPRRFYERVAGIAGERSYVTLARSFEPAQETTVQTSEAEPAR